jgi:predicted RNA-binding Zn ribbon-like protein
VKAAGCGVTHYTGYISVGQFEFISGSQCLDFVDTLGNRRAEPVERLAAPADLDRWLRAAGLGGPFRRKSTSVDLASARTLRDAVFRFAMSAIEDAPPGVRDIRTINRWAMRMPLRPTIAGDRIQMTAKQPIEAALSTIAAEAIEMVLGPQRSRIRVCPECRMVFVDTSRPGKRRWCSSASGCGNRAKVRAHRSRVAEAS